MNWQLNWLTPYYTYLGQNLYTFNLRDEFEYGDAVKVYIPKANESDPQEYLWITNHQKKSRYDGISRGSNTCYQINQNEIEPFCSVGKGLFIFHESDRYCPNNINGFNSAPMINTWRHYAFDIKSANGRWNWDLDTHVVDPYLGAFDIQKILGRNIISGINKFNKYYLRAYPKYSAQLLSRDICWNPPNYKITADFHGDGKDAYNMGYNEILSPYSNSSSNNFQQPSFNTGVTIRLNGQDPENGNINISIYYDETQALNICPPSKPSGIKHDFFYPPNGGWCVPQITWDHNIEPDMLRNDGTKKYQIWRATEPDMSNGCNNFMGIYYLIDTKDIPADVTPHYEDLSVLEYDCALFDQVPPFGTRYPVRYKVKAVDLSNKESVFSDFAYTTGITPNGGKQEEARDNFVNYSSVPKEFKIFQNYPNPFNPVTNIKYDLPKNVLVSLKIYDLLGREIKKLIDEYKQAGSYIVSFNGSEFASGIYFYKIQAGDFVRVKRMVLIK